MYNFSHQYFYHNSEDETVLPAKETFFLKVSTKKHGDGFLFAKATEGL